MIFQAQAVKLPGGVNFQGESTCFFSAPGLFFLDSGWQEAPQFPIGELEDMPLDRAQVRWLVVVFLVPHGSEFFRQSLWDDKG